MGVSRKKLKSVIMHGVSRILKCVKMYGVPWSVVVMYTESAKTLKLVIMYGGSCECMVSYECMHFGRNACNSVIMPMESAVTMFFS